MNFHLEDYQTLLGIMEVFKNYIRFLRNHAITLLFLKHHFRSVFSCIRLYPIQNLLIAYLHEASFKLE